MSVIILAKNHISDTFNEGKYFFNFIKSSWHKRLIRRQSGNDWKEEITLNNIVYFFHIL